MPQVERRVGYRAPVEDAPEEPPVVVRAMENGAAQAAFASLVPLLAIALSVALHGTNRQSALASSFSAFIVLLILRATACRAQLVYLDVVRDELRHERRYLLRGPEHAMTLPLSWVSDAAIAASDESGNSHVCLTLAGRDGRKMELCTTRHEAALAIVFAIRAAALRATELHPHEREPRRGTSTGAVTLIHIRNPYARMGGVFLALMSLPLFFAVALWRGVTVECSRTDGVSVCLLSDALRVGADPLRFDPHNGTLTVAQRDSDGGPVYLLALDHLAWRSESLRKEQVEAAASACRQFRADPNARAQTIVARGSPWPARVASGLFVLFALLVWFAFERTHVLIDPSRDRLHVVTSRSLARGRVDRHVLSLVDAAAVEPVEDSESPRVMLQMGTTKVELIRAPAEESRAIVAAIACAVFLREPPASEV